MNLQWEDHRSGTVVHLSGELVADDVDVLRRRCEERVSHGLRLIVDIRNCDRVDSAGLEALLWLHDRVQGVGGQFRLVRGGGQPADAVQVTRLDRRLAVHTTLEAAARSFSKGQAA
jgi:anti-anti-sigma factor